VLGQKPAEARHHPQEDDENRGGAGPHQHQRVDQCGPEFAGDLLVVLVLIDPAAERLGELARCFAGLHQLVEIPGHRQLGLPEGGTEALAAADRPFHPGERSGQLRVVVGLGERRQRDRERDPGLEQRCELLQHQLRLARGCPLAPEAARTVLERVERDHGQALRLQCAQRLAFARGDDVR
jgi:hypothetical protein